VNVPPLGDQGTSGGECAPRVAAKREEEDVDEIRRKLGDRVYGSAIAWAAAVAGLIVLLILRAVIGL
jgi:hypothetical protein